MNLKEKEMEQIFLLVEFVYVKTLLCLFKAFMKSVNLAGG